MKMSLEGKIASQGKASGKAFVTNNPKEEPPNEDYILVTKNCSPEISPLIYRAKGVVTEIGGLMSHLAVVSREMNIPCIIACASSYSELKKGYIIRINATEKLNTKINIEYDT
jgi:pyruvate,water dikinase